MVSVEEMHPKRTPTIKICSFSPCIPRLLSADCGIHPVLRPRKLTRNLDVISLVRPQVRSGWDYSWRSASAGSTRVARRAGIVIAINATNVNPNATAAKMNGSVGLT